VSSFIYSASVGAANLMRLEEALGALEAAGCDELHFEIRDGQCAPDFGLNAGFVRAAKACCALPCTAHLEVARPEAHVARFAEAGCDAIIVALETSRHVHRLVSLIREAGAAPGLALHPATPLTKLDYVLDDVDRVLLLSAQTAPHDETDPGRAAFDRVRILRQNVAYRERPVRIAVAGGMTPRNAALLARAGADVFVLDRDVLFKGEDVADDLAQFKAEMAHQQHLV